MASAMQQYQVAECLAAACVLLAAGFASAQNSGQNSGQTPSQNQNPPAQPQRVNSPPPPVNRGPKGDFITGVRAELPNPLSGGLSGVPAALPGPLGGRGSGLDRHLPLPGEPPTQPSTGPATPPPNDHPSWGHGGWMGWGSGSWGYGPVGRGHYAPVGYGGVDPFLADGLRPLRPAIPVPALVDNRPATERAEEAYRAGRFDRAIELLRDHLKAEADDAAAARLLGLVLIDAGKPAEGADLIFQTYQAHPVLVRETLRAADLPGGRTRMAERRGRVLGLASRNTSPGPDFVAAVMAESEGRADVAAKLLDRAVRAGLSKPLTEEFGMVLPEAVRPVVARPPAEGGSDGVRR